jgi:hypothetical protein
VKKDIDRIVSIGEKKTIAVAQVFSSFCRKKEELLIEDEITCLKLN